MTTRHIIELDSVMLLAISVTIGVLFALSATHKPMRKSSFSLPVMDKVQNVQPTVTPLPLKVEMSSQLSPDGSHKLALAITTNPDGSKTYDFTTSDGGGGSKQALYTSTKPSNEMMSIPFNTWSPDNAYVFVQEKTASGSSALVMKASGESFSTDQKYLDVGAVFSAKNTGNTYQVTTGWASDTLLIVNSMQSDGTKGPSYWFETPSQAIIQLSTPF